MLWLTLGISTLLILGWSLTVVMLLNLVKQERMSTATQLMTWNRERESLLNRLMTKTWETFVQVETAQIQNSSSTSDSYVGMSDEEEMKRIAAYYQDTVGIGETLVDMTDDLRELGIDVGDR